MSTTELLPINEVATSKIVQAIIINEDEEILLKMRPREPERYRLDFFSTFWKPDESHLDAVSRVIESDLAIYVCEDAIQYTGSVLLDYTRFTGKKCTIYPFVVQNLRDEIRVFGPNMRWYTKDELINADLAFDNKETLRGINFL